MGRVGGYGHNSSGDLFFAFATGNHLEERPGKLRMVATVPNESMDPLFHAVVESTEESISNVLFAAETTTGRFDGIAHALPLDLWHRSSSATGLASPELSLLSATASVMAVAPGSLSGRKARKMFSARW